MVDQVTFPEVILSIAVFLAAGALLSPLAERVNIPSSVVLVVLGLFVGAFLRETRLLDLGIADLGGDTFDDIVQFVFLPTLVFAAAREISTRLFMRNLVPILALAIPATGLSMVLVGFGIHQLVGLPLASAMVFGALISSTDPVAVVEAFKRLGVDERLATIVSGESLLNDGIAIVAYTIMVLVAAGDSISVAAGGGEFVVVFLGGLAIGLILGLAASVVLARLDDLASTTFTVAVAYGSFATSELLGYSGVVATLTVGLLIGATTSTTSSPRVRRWLEGLWGSLEFGMTGVLFLLMGLVLDPDLIAEHWGAILLALLTATVARALVVALVVPLATTVPGVPAVGRRGQVVLVWGGLRGAIALALALAIPSDVPGEERIVAMTFGVVLATILVNATTIGALIARFGLNRPSRNDRLVGAITAAQAAHDTKQQLVEMEIETPEVGAKLDRVVDGFARLEPDDDEIVRCVRGYALAVERSVYQRRLDTGMMTGPDGPRLIHEVERDLDRIWLGSDEPVPGRAVRAVEWLEEQVARAQPRVRDEVAARYLALHSRRIATSVAAHEVAALVEALDLRSPSAEAVVGDLEDEAAVALDDIAALDERHPERARQVWEAGRTMRSGVLAREAIEELVRRHVVSRRAADLAESGIEDAFGLEAEALGNLFDERER